MNLKKYIIVITTFFKDVYDIFVRNGGLFVRTIGVGTIGIFSAFTCVLSFRTQMLFTGGGDMFQVSIFSGFIAIVVISYFVFRWEAVKHEYTDLHIRYLNWINTRSSFQRWLVSVPMSFSLSLSQFLLIMIMKYFTRLSGGAIADITLAIVGIINFFMMRTYLFDYQRKNYFFQFSSYIIISVVSLFVNYHVVNFLEKSQFWILQPVGEILTTFLDATVVAQLLASALFGWVFYKAHEKITFRKKEEKNI